jgi:diguanylate cyclase (GGDEF)-like protein
LSSLLLDLVDTSWVKYHQRPVAGSHRKPTHLSRVGLLVTLFVAGLLSPALPLAGPKAKSDSAQSSPAQLRTITTAREAHELSTREAARGYPIHLRAVITYFEPTIVNHGWVAMFVHDSTGCIFVFVKSGSVAPIPSGTLIDLRGVSAPGWFAPVVAHPQIKVIGYAGLPANAYRPSFAQLFSGSEDSQWVELEGVIHSIVDEDGHIILQMIMDDRPITVNMGSEPGAAYSGLIDSKIRIRGNAGAVYDAKHTHMIGVRLTCPNLSAVQILEAQPSDPFRLQPVPIDKLLNWDMAPALAHRVHLRGRVTLQWPGTLVCIRDATEGICAQTEQNTRLQNGELIDIAGFVRVEGSAPTLNDAVFKSSDSSTAVPVEAAPATADEILAGEHDSQLVTIDGQLLSRDLSSSDTTLLVSSGKFIFKAILPQSMSGQESKEWENGSLLRITGISSVQIEAQRSGLRFVTAAPTTFRVRLRSPADVVVLKRPSWWTASHMMIVLAVALAGTLVVLGWVILLRKRLRESEERFRHMALHDALTGLATRLLLQDRLHIAIESAKRHGAGLALLMVDLDKFKGINDSFGHPAGDEVLRVTADRILETVRSSDTVARLGGDEFAVLLAGLNDSRMAEVVAANLVKALACPISLESSEVPVSVSIGLCIALAGDLDEDQLMKNADAALYCAKKRGRGRYEVFTPALLIQD